jgi:hypothetical protein
MTERSAGKEGEGVFLNNPENWSIFFLTSNISAKTIPY